ncbi:hypothetical protein AAE478_001321 [Parahypoxylon ruwenzoriense]
MPNNGIQPHACPPEPSRRSPGISSSLDDLFGDPAESIGAGSSPGPEPAAIPPHEQDPVYGLRWVSDGHHFSPRPEWTVEPTLDSIALTLQAVIGPGKQYLIQHGWDGVYNKIYTVSYDQKRFIMRVSLPVCPKIKTESEVATLQWIYGNTNLPVPKVKCYDSSRDNPLGFEWILMDRMYGVPLSQCWNSVTQGAKERIVKQIAAYAAVAFERQFRGIGSIYPSELLTRNPRGSLPPVGEMGERASIHRYSIHFRTALKWTKRRLRLVSADLRLKVQETANDGHRETATRMLKLTQRLRELEDRFFPTPDFSIGWELNHEDDDESTDEEDGAVDEGSRPREPTMLWHDNISLDNILVDENGILCGIIDWECVSCLPLYEACQFPAFLQQARDRPVEPLTPYGVARKPPSSQDLQKYDEDLREHHVYLLRKLFLEEMMYRCPAWVEIFRNRGGLRDYEVAVQNCDNEFAYKEVEKWIDAVEKGGDSCGAGGRLREQFMR